MAIIILNDSPPKTIMLMMHLFAFLNFPFVVLSIYLFFYLIRGLLEKEASLGFNKFYFIFWAIIFLVQVVLTKNYFDTNDDRFLNSFFQGINVLAITSMCLISLYVLLSAKEFSSKIKKRAIRNFGFIYLFCFLFSSSLTSKYMIPYFGTFKVLVTVFLFFSLNLPSLLYLKYYLDKHYKEPQLQPETEADLNELFSEFDISNREQEIIHLILRGRSNTEIKNALFISLHTVKNHIYSIYQKLGVKSRLQINNLIRDYLHKKRK